MQFKNTRQPSPNFVLLKGSLPPTTLRSPDNIHLNILVPQGKLDVIMHPPSGQKTVVAHTFLWIISGTALMVLGASR